MHNLSTLDGVLLAGTHSCSAPFTMPRQVSLKSDYNTVKATHVHKQTRMIGYLLELVASTRLEASRVVSRNQAMLLLEINSLLYRFD